MTREEITKNIVRGITDKIEATTDIDDWAKFWGFTRDDYEEFLDKALEQEPILDKIRAEIEEKIEQEEFARSVFRHEEKDTFKAEQCTGSIMAYNNMIKLINKYKAEKEE